MGRENKPTGCCNCGFRDIRLSDKYCQKCGAELCDKAKSAHSDLEKENYELRQQLAQVQAELAKVLAELKKLTGKENKKLEQQQVENEKVMKNYSTASQIKEQVQKSQTLMKELSLNEKTTASEKNEPKNSSLPYLIGGALLVAGGLGALAISCLIKKRSKK